MPSIFVYKFGRPDICFPAIMFRPKDCSAELYFGRTIFRTKDGLYITHTSIFWCLQKILRAMLRFALCVTFLREFLARDGLRFARDFSALCYFFAWPFCASCVRFFTSFLCELCEVLCKLFAQLCEVLRELCEVLHELFARAMWGFAWDFCASCVTFLHSARAV